MDAFETELAALIERHAQKLTDNQIITVLERALDEALVIAGDPEASRVRADLLEVAQAAAKTFRNYEASHEAKGTVEGAQKAAANAYMAKMCEAAIAKATGQ